MAILFWEGGEGYQSADIRTKFNSVGVCTGANVITSSSVVRSSAKGTRSIVGDGNTFYLTVSESTIYVEFWWTHTFAFDSQPIIYLQNSSGGNHFSINVAVTSGIAVISLINANGTQVGSSINLYAVNVWTHFGIKLVVGDAGNVTLTIDDVVRVSAVSSDFQNSTSTVSRVLFNFFSFSGNPYRFDDIVVQDSAGAFLGSGVHSVALFPSAAGDSTQWTPSAGSNYQCVDEVDPNDDTDYVTDSTTGHLDLYNVSDLPSYTGTVLGVDTWAMLRKDSGGVEQCKIALKTNSTVYYGSTLSPGNSYDVSRHLALVNPNTGVAWTQANVNALQIGMEVV